MKVINEEAIQYRNFNEVSNSNPVLINPKHEHEQEHEMTVPIIDATPLLTRTFKTAQGTKRWDLGVDFHHAFSWVQNLILLVANIKGILSFNL